MDSEMGETPNQQVNLDAGGRWRDLNGQLECGLEVLIGWVSYAHLAFPGRSSTRLLTHAGFN